MTSLPMAAPADHDTGAVPDSEPGLSALLDAVAARLGDFNAFAAARIPTDLIYHWAEGDRVHQLYGSDLAMAGTAAGAWAALAWLVDTGLPDGTLAALARVEAFAGKYRDTQLKPGGALASIDGAMLIMDDVENLAMVLRFVDEVARRHWDSARATTLYGDNAQPTGPGM